jgi:glycosyltransferase involved in cell wall biosynthesis
MQKKLLIILSDSLKDLIDKGEVIPRYYNPKNTFNEVHFLLINQNTFLEKNFLQELVGNSTYHVHFLNLNFIEKINLFFFNKLSNQKILNKVKAIKPQLVRCYNVNFAIFIAHFFYSRFAINYIISIHYDLLNYLYNKKNLFLKFVFFFLLNKKLIKILRKALVVLAVYYSATNYLRKYKIKNYIINYNFIRHIKQTKKSKNDFLNLLCVKRQNYEMNPLNIILAVKELKKVKLTLIGDGCFHNSLINYVKNLKITSKVKFIKRMSNNKILKNLTKYDCTIFCVKNAEFSKSMIESISAGVPIIVNSTIPPTKELNKKFCLFTDGTISGYKKAINKLIKNPFLIKRLGNNAFKEYRKKFHTNNLEQQHSMIYKLNLNKYSKKNNE